jgi:hypothetical protein
VLLVVGDAREPGVAAGGRAHRPRPVVLVQALRGSRAAPTRARSRRRRHRRRPRPPSSPADPIRTRSLHQAPAYDDAGGYRSRVIPDAPAPSPALASRLR